MATERTQSPSDDDKLSGTKFWKKVMPRCRGARGLALVLVGLLIPCFALPTVVQATEIDF